jgi:hypothetical protein
MQRATLDIKRRSVLRRFHFCRPCSALEQLDWKQLFKGAKNLARLLVNTIHTNSKDETCDQRKNLATTTSTNNGTTQKTISWSEALIQHCPISTHDAFCCYYFTVKPEAKHFQAKQMSDKHRMPV